MKRIFIIAIALLGLCLNDSVWAGKSSVESLVNEGKWRNASRNLFLEARRISPRLWGLAREQALAGFVADAVETAEAKPVGMRPVILLEVAEKAPDLDDSERLHLLQRALSYARQTEVGRLALTSISMAYLQLGYEEDARRVYEEALTSAAKLPGIHRRMADDLVMKEDVRLQAWMLHPLVASLDKMSDAEEVAHTCAALARLQIRAGLPEAALQTVQTGFTAAQRIARVPARRIANKRLAQVAIELGDMDAARQYGSDEVLAPDYAIHAAALGYHEEALAIIADLNANLYVDYRSETLGTIISGALKRGDVEAARIFIGQLPEGHHRLRAQSWTHLAESELAGGNRSGAEAAYKAAWSQYAHSFHDSVYAWDIDVLIELARSLRRSGFTDSAGTIADALPSFVDRISSRRIADRIKAEAAVATLYAERDQPRQASAAFLSAYQRASGARDGTTGGHDIESQAESLMVVASALAEAARKTP
ncbi:tetratricopeptide repeat protein [Pseudomonas sp. CR3202]|uniref:tetratricopeptide repeat protein n=1 Tax=Pseudomonas sp. CR3202 TaxID=3351532 RepID=UPI003BEF9C65